MKENIAIFFKDYLKRYGILAALLSFVCLILFFSAIIPADAAISSGSFGYTHKYIGGVQVSASKASEAYDASIPRNAAGERLRSIGEFKVTHYCACTICTWGSGVTASGKAVAEGMIAADWGVLPQGTKVYLKSGGGLVEKVVEDTGGAINDKRIDIYVPDHNQALALGVYTTELYVDPGVELP